MTYETLPNKEVSKFSAKKVANHNSPVFKFLFCNKVNLQIASKNKLPNLIIYFALQLIVRK